MLNGIDISNWQPDIDLSKLTADFVIMKATQGIDYVSPVCDIQYTGAKSANKLRGVYHYADGSGAINEAKYFLSNVKNYVGDAILALDWEGDVVSQGVSYAKIWLDYVYQQTNVRPVIYMSKSVTNAYDWSMVSSDYALWGAQYASGGITGYQDNPWTDENAWGSWSTPTIFQYSSHGRLAGYDGNLDLDKFYGDTNAWKSIQATVITTTTTTVVDTSVPIVQYSDSEGNRAYAYTHWEAIVGKPELNVLESPNGTKYQLTVNDKGELSAKEIK